MKDLKFSAYAPLQKPKIKEFRENQSICPYDFDIQCWRPYLNFGLLKDLRIYCQKCAWYVSPALSSDRISLGTPAFALRCP